MEISAGEWVVAKSLKIGSAMFLTLICHSERSEEFASWKLTLPVETLLRNVSVSIVPDRKIHGDCEQDVAELRLYQATGPKRARW